MAERPDTAYRRQTTWRRKVTSFPLSRWRQRRDRCCSSWARRDGVTLRRCYTSASHWPRCPTTPHVIHRRPCSLRRQRRRRRHGSTAQRLLLLTTCMLQTASTADSWQTYAALSVASSRTDYAGVWQTNNAIGLVSARVLVINLCSIVDLYPTIRTPVTHRTLSVGIFYPQTPKTKCPSSSKYRHVGRTWPTRATNK